MPLPCMSMRPCGDNDDTTIIYPVTMMGRATRLMRALLPVMMTTAMVRVTVMCFM